MPLSPAVDLPSNRVVAKNKPSNSLPTDWHDVADWYDQLVGESGSEFHQHVVLPGTLKLLAVQPGDAVLDLACGQGVLCRLLATRQALATGVDAATDLIRAARTRNDALAASGYPIPEFLVGDVRNLKFLPERKFVAAACILAIQNIHPIQPVFAEAARVLKEMGRLVIVMMHPCFRGAKETHWGWDDKSKVQYRRVDRYLIPRKSPIVTHPGQSTQYTWTFHKPIEDFVKAARQEGMMVDAIEEWPSHKVSDSGPRAAAENTARKEIPMFMAMRLVNVGKMRNP